MVYAGIAQYVEAAFGVTEFWINDKRIVKTQDGTWLWLK